MLIDLNSDMGEIPELVQNGVQEAIMAHISSVNIACGGHAGDENIILQTLLQAKRFGVKVGAHPSYPDRASFGRKTPAISEEALIESIYQQLCYLAGLAQRAGVEIRHVKPHGALYNDGADQPAVAASICKGVLKFSKNMILVGLASSSMIDVFKSHGFEVLAEGFIDRRYENNGRLRSRSLPGALITDQQESLKQALDLAMKKQVTTYEGKTIPLDVQTLCVHSDTAGADVLAALVAKTLF